MATEIASQELQNQLDQIITWFESDDVDIDQAEDKYQQALNIIRELSARIEKTENAITKLKQSFEKE